VAVVRLDANCSAGTSKINQSIARQAHSQSLARILIQVIVLRSERPKL